MHVSVVRVIGAPPHSHTRFLAANLFQWLTESVCKGEGSAGRGRKGKFKDGPKEEVDEFPKEEYDEA